MKVQSAGINSKLAWDVLFVASLLAIAIASWLGFVVKAAKPEMPLNTHGKLLVLQKTTKQQEGKIEEAKADIARRTWTDSPEGISSKVLEVCNRECAQHQLRVTRFRVTNPIVAPLLLEIPFTLVVEGKFLDVMALVRSFEKPDSKIALSELRVNRANNSKGVNASLSLAAFANKETK